MSTIHLPGKGKKYDVEQFKKRLDYLKKWGLALITTIILCVLMSTPFLWDRVSLKIGDIAPQDIRAHQTVQYLDTVHTNIQREDAAKRAKRAYLEVRYASQDAQDVLQMLFDDVAESDSYHETSFSAKSSLLQSRIQEHTKIHLPITAVQTLLQADAEARQHMRVAASSLVEYEQGREIRNEGDDLARARQDVADRTKAIGLPTEETDTVDAIASAALRPNRLYDAKSTLKDQEEARRNVVPVYQQIRDGDLIIGRGNTVRQEHLDKLLALGLVHPSQDPLNILWSCLLTLGMVVLVGVYLRKFQKKIIGNTKQLLLLCLVVLICVIGLKVSGTLLDVQFSSIQLCYQGMMWIAVCGMLTAVLMDSQLAILLVGLLAVLTSLTFNNDLHFAVASFVSGLSGILCVTNIRNRTDWLRTAGIVCGVNLITVWILGGMRGDTLYNLGEGSFWAVSVGAASTFIFWFGVALLERPFGITTHIRLLELSDPNNPVLRKLLLEAPGTYHHSIVVGNLAEGGAEVVGADSLLVRVASYYHDIGKTKRPHYFVENQNVENIHDSMNPTLSTLVITSHVKDGIEIGKHFKLPPQILELICQHHGTGLVSYFYHQAASESEMDVDERHFRYEGPKPQTREAAILMLADAVEAAARTMNKPTPNKIEGLVTKIVRDRQADGQLDECDLTFSDLDRIIAAFVRILVAMYHSRIEYPDMTVETKKTNGEGNSDNNPTGITDSGESGNQSSAGLPLS